MTLSQIAIWILGTFGFAYILGSSRLTLPARVWFAATIAKESPNVRRLGLFFLNGIECPACLSFHIGWIAGMASGYRWFSFVIACIVTGSSYVLARLTGLMDS